MSAEGKDPAKKHRHDVGDVAHGPEQTTGVTRTIQGVLGLWIVLTGLLVVYAFAQIGFEAFEPADAVAETQEPAAE